MVATNRTELEVLVGLLALGDFVLRLDFSSLFVLTFKPVGLQRLLQELLLLQLLHKNVVVVLEQLELVGQLGPLHFTVVAAAFEAGELVNEAADLAMAVLQLALHGLLLLLHTLHRVDLLHVQTAHLLVVLPLDLLLRTRAAALQLLQLPAQTLQRQFVLALHQRNLLLHNRHR